MVGLLVLLVGSSGCHIVYPGRHPAAPAPCVPPEVPRELAKTTLPDYIIEPPDVLGIQAISLIPKAPYHLRPLDMITVVMTGVPPEANLSGQYIVPPDGTIQFGLLGNVQAAGRTTDEVQQQLQQMLEVDFREPHVWVTLAQLAAQQQIIGEHLVAPDGTVNLGTYGRVRVVGLTIEEARAAVELHLSRHLQDPQISLDVLGYNSKVYYVITQGAGFGDRVAILPSTGNETVLDAIGQIEGLASNHSTRMWVSRPGKNDCDGDQILPVDWVAITQRGDATSNFQVLPGDRVFVSEDKLVAFDTRLGKIISPIERVFGVTALGTRTVQSLIFFDRFGTGRGVGDVFP